MRTRPAALQTGLFLANTPGWAHHGTATDFDTTKLLVLQGTATEMEWINPHAWLHLLVKDSDGKVSAWRIEGGSPAEMASRKFPKESITAGVEISITAYPAKSGENVADGATITFQGWEEGLLWWLGSGGRSRQGRTALHCAQKHPRHRSGVSKSLKKKCVAPVKEGGTVMIHKGSFSGYIKMS